MGKIPTSRRSPVTWDALNTRQQKYLAAIYQADQEVEAEERSSWRRGGHPRPAAQWRWMPYGTSVASKMPLPVKKHLLATEQVSAGTGSTLEALEQRGLITMRHLSTETLRQRCIVSEWMAFLELDPIPVIQITSTGRKLVRQALQLSVPKPQPTGTLQEWHWRALASAYGARATKGVTQDGGGNYGHIRWKTWLRLRDYIPAALVQEQSEPGCSTSSSSLLTDYYLQITAFGIAFYERAWIRYQQFYPEISTLTPEPLLDPATPYIEVVQAHRSCRACRGRYLVTVSRTYQQDPKKWTWSLQEQEQRIEGNITILDEEGEQCICQETDIQEVQEPFLALLDRLAACGWQLRFVGRHHWYDYLEYLVSGCMDGQAYYDPAQVQQKMQPLLYDTDLADNRNIVKGEVRYCYNEQRERGSIYPLGPGNWSTRPVAVTCHLPAKPLVSE